MNTKIIEPNDYDVLSGRGNGCTRHIGNVRLRCLVARYRDEYINSETSDHKKRIIVSRIIDEVLNGNPPGRFLIKSVCGQFWCHLDKKARNKKVAQAIRDVPKKDLEVELYNPDNDKSINWEELKNSNEIDCFGKSAMNALMNSQISLDVPERNVVKAYEQNQENDPNFNATVSWIFVD